MHQTNHILITGASSGIGTALSLLYAAKGVVLSLHGRDRQRLDSIADQARQKGAEVCVHTGDIRNAEDVANWIKSRDAQTPIDLVIANAGISRGTAEQGETPEQAVEVFAVNLTGVLNTVHPAIPLMSARKRGQIAIISSLAGFRGLAGAPAYCASKAAVRVYGEGLRAELAPLGVRVNIVCPGFIKTPMTDVNTFPMPLLMTPERAATIIRKGLARNTSRIAFPLRMYAAVLAFSALPQPLIDWVASCMPRK